MFAIDFPAHPDCRARFAEPIHIPFDEIIDGDGSPPPERQGKNPTLSTNAETMRIQEFMPIVQAASPDALVSSEICV